MKTCPFCAEEIPDATIDCPQCGRSLIIVGTPPLNDWQTRTGMDIVLRGRQGKTLTVAKDVIRIEKKGFTGKREKTILIRNITSVEVKKPGGFVGFIQFSIAGGKARDGSYTVTGGAFDAVKDENSVVFNGNENYEVALRVKAYVESWAVSKQQDHLQPVAVSTADEIRRFKALFDEGLLTAEEFAQKKKQLLGL